MKIDTERLFLREMTPEDFNALYAVLADSDIMQNIGSTILPEIGYHIARAHQHQSFAREAAGCS